MWATGPQSENLSCKGSHTACTLHDKFVLVLSLSDKLSVFVHADTKWARGPGPLCGQVTGPLIRA